MVCTILDGLMNIMIHADKLLMLDSAIDIVEECDGLDKIEKLQNSPNEEIYQAAYKLIDTYFNDEEGEYDSLVEGNENIAPGDEYEKFDF